MVQSCTGLMFLINNHAITCVEGTEHERKPDIRNTMRPRGGRSLKVRHLWTDGWIYGRTHPLKEMRRRI